MSMSQEEYEDQTNLRKNSGNATNEKLTKQNELGTKKTKPSKKAQNGSSAHAAPEEDNLLEDDKDSDSDGGVEMPVIV